jgi:hypothetical protein
MPAELLTEGVEDDEEIFIAWLQPLRNSGVARFPGATLPFTMVRHIDGKENVDESTADCVVQVETLCDKNLGGEGRGWAAASDEANATHQRILLLARHLPDVPLSGGRIATVDYVKVFSMPRWTEYGDENILDKLGRYTIGLSYTTVP